MRTRRLFNLKSYLYEMRKCLRVSTFFPTVWTVNQKYKSYPFEQRKMKTALRNRYVQFSGSVLKFSTHQTLFISEKLIVDFELAVPLKCMV